MVITTPQHGTFQVAKLVEQKQRVVAGAAEVAVVGQAFLLSICLAHRAVQVEDQLLGWLSLVNPVDPIVGKVDQLLEVALCAEDLRLEPAYLAAGSSLLVLLTCPMSDTVGVGTAEVERSVRFIQVPFADLRCGVAALFHNLGDELNI